MPIAFVKMEGAGNDYIYIDARKGAPRNPARLARTMSDRHFGIGADGLILIRKSARKGVKYRMQMFNADGSEGEMCGNGLRCVAKYLYDRKLETSDAFAIETGAGVLQVEISATNGARAATEIRVNLGRPQLNRGEIPVRGHANARLIDQPLKVGRREFRITCVGMGNPHCVIFLAEPADVELVQTIGPLIENHRMFPNRTNVEFVYRKSSRRLLQRTWERGSGETLACGTGAAAVCVAAHLNGLTGRKVKIELAGGTLDLHWNAADDCVYKTGPAVEVYSGVWPQ